MSSGKVFLGIVAGVATGALIGILFAPDKGSETRKKISKKGEDYSESLKDKFNEFIDSITEKFEELKDEVSDIGDSGKSNSNETKKETQTANS